MRISQRQMPGTILPSQGKPQHSRHPKLKRIVLTSVSIFAIILLLLSALTFWFIQRTLPQTTGTFAVAGLEQPVSVGRDQWSVPHITASNLHDVIFAQGYTTAQDRLFQMELNRRIAQGHLAELFGNDFVSTDAFLRTLGIYRTVKSRLAHIDAQTLGLLQVYTDGVNAFLTTHKNNLPLEFTLLGITPKPWTPADSLASATNVALSLDSAWYYKYTHALLSAKVGSSVANVLFPTYPAESPTLISSPSSQTATTAPQALTPDTQTHFALLSTDLLQGATTLHALLGDVNGSLGSNSWVVDGSRTVSGKPLLANDPHLDINIPSTWYEVALEGGGLNVIGFSLPGTPGVIIGHNSSIAWGITNVEADDTDLYMETLDPINHPGRYLYNHQWLPLQTHQESIHSRDTTKPFVITVSSTIHGPILNSAVSDLKGYTPISLKWTLLQPEYTLTGFFQLDFATNWSQFLAALKNISISQNFVYADVSGNIGYRMSGLLPIRPANNDLLPVDGSTSAYEWRGYVPQKDMPTLFNPPSHVIVTANNQMVPASYPFYITAYWDQGYRARRINDLLTMTSRLTIADDERIQADVYSIPAATLTPFFIEAGRSASGEAAAAAKLLQGWNYTMRQDSVAASVYEVTVSTLLRETLEPLLGKHLYTIYASNYLSSGLFTLLINLLTTPAAPFFGITDSSNTNLRRDAAITHALADAMNQLQTKLGSDPSQWSWGKLHQAQFDHPLASTWPLNFIFGVSSLERPGDSVTVNVGGDDNFSADPPDYDQHTISSMREIIDLSNLDNSLWIITTGESGQPFSAHYNDLNPLWNQNHYQQMGFSSQAQNKVIKELLMLAPS